METFSTLLAVCAGNSPVTGNSPHKGQWRGALMFYLICAWINGWVNNREAGDLRRHRPHYDVTAMYHGRFTMKSDPMNVQRTSLTSSGECDRKNINAFLKAPNHAKGTCRFSRITINVVVSIKYIKSTLTPVRYKELWWSRETVHEKNTTKILFVCF